MKTEDDPIKQHTHSAMTVDFPLALADQIVQLYAGILTADTNLADTLFAMKEHFVDSHNLRYRFNVISAAARGKLKEIAHSLILANMLHHPLFQKSFISYFLGIEHLGTMHVDTEFGDSHSHVDILLHDRSHCIIIENKVNGAVEQPQQVYRYVHDIAEQELKIGRQHIYVLYLNPTHYNYPSTQSITDDKGQDNLMDALGERFAIRTFSRDIIGWLQQLETVGDPIIESGIRQYQDYLENYFHVSKIYQTMNKEIDDHILKEYAISESEPLDQQIKILTLKKENVDYLSGRLGSLIKDKKSDLATIKLEAMYNQLLNDFQGVGEFYKKTKLENRPFINIGVGIEKDGLKINFHIEYDCDKDKICYGIICSKKDYCDTYNKLTAMFQPYMDSLPSTKTEAASNWPVWRYTSFENAYIRLKALVEYALAL